MADIIPPRLKNSNQKGKVYWPQTNIPYEEATAFKAATVYAEVIEHRYNDEQVWREEIQQKSTLIRRAAELLGHWAELGGPGDDMMKLASWMRDAGYRLDA